MPVTTGDQFAEALRGINTSSPEAVRNAQTLGRVAVTQQVKQTQRIDEAVTENTVAKPKPVPPPEKPPEANKNAPVITMNGATTITLKVGDTYTESGATCVDDKDPTCTVGISGAVNTAVAGTYTITYTAVDSAGNQATPVTRTVVVGDVVVPPTPNSAPTAVNFASTGTPTAGSLTVGQVVGQLSCVDVAPTGAQNACTYTTTDANFAVSTTGSLTVKNPNLAADTYTVSVVATDAGGLTKTGTASVTVKAVADPVPTGPALSNVTTGDG